jgi:hypothetical protein
MNKFYCNGKKGFCDTYDGDITSNCYDCIYHDETGGKVVEFITQFDRIKSMTVVELARFLAEQVMNQEQVHLLEKDITATHLEFLKDTLFKGYLRYLESEVTE